ncbi:MAG: DUF2339 domain-containing protein [Chloroflexota bacterium]
MPERDELHARIDELERKVFERLSRLEQIVLKEETATAQADVPTVQVLDQAEEIKSDTRQALESIAAASVEVAPDIVETSVSQTEETAASPSSVYRGFEPIQDQERETPQWIKNLTDIEWLTSRIGISLLLIGVVTTLLWLNDQPWVTDWMRLAVGYGVGAVLLGLGLRLTKNRPSFGQLLVGGGIASGYITTFWGFFILETIPDITTLVIVFFITLLAYGLSIWNEQPSLAYVGLLFGLLTPFIVQPEDPSIVALMFYICLVLLGPVAIYYSLSWNGLMLVSSILGWLIMAIVAIGLSTADMPERIELFAVQGGVIFALIGFGLIPLLKMYQERAQLDPAEILAERAQRLAAQAASAEAESDEQLEPIVDEVNPLLRPHWASIPLIVASPIVAAGTSFALWPEINVYLWAVLMVVGAIAYLAAGYRAGQDTRFEILQLPLLIVGGALLLFAPLQATDSLAPLLLIIASLEAVGFAAYARREDQSGVSILALLLFFGGLAVWGNLIILENNETPLFNLNFVASLIFVSSLVGAAFVERDGFKQVYAAAAHFIALIAIGFEIFALNENESYWLLVLVLINIGVFAAGFFLQRRNLKLQSIAFAGITTFAHLVLLPFEELSLPNLMMVILAIQVAGVCAVAKWEDDQLTWLGGYGLAAMGGVAVLIQLFSTEFTIPFVSLSALSSLIMMVALLIVALWYTQKPMNLIIGVGTHLLALTWIAVQCQDFIYEQGIITALWAVYAVALLVAGLVFDRNIMRNLGIGTILLTVAKLIVVDLENVAVGGRVLLFSGFGVVLLLISYFTRTLWRKSEEETEAAAEVAVGEQ